MTLLMVWLLASFAGAVLVLPAGPPSVPVLVLRIVVFGLALAIAIALVPGIDRAVLVR